MLMETIFPPDHLALTHVNEVAPNLKTPCAEGGFDF